MAGCGGMAPDGAESQLAEPCFFARPRWGTAYSGGSPSPRPQLTLEPDTLAQPQDTASFFLGMRQLLVNFSLFYFPGTSKEPTSLNMGRREEKVSSSEIRAPLPSPPML